MRAVLARQKPQGPFYEEHFLRGLVLTRYKPVDALFGTSSQYLGRMVYQMLDCKFATPSTKSLLIRFAGLHSFRYSKARMVLPGISPGSIMYEDRCDGPHFVLMGIEAAVRVKRDGRLKTRSATHYQTDCISFLACDVLEHLGRSADYSKDSPAPPIFTCSLRHSYESLLWLMLWYGMTAEFPAIADPALKVRIECEVAAWQTGSLSDLWTHKHGVLARPGAWAHLPLTPRFAPWAAWFFAWLALFADGDGVARRRRESTRCWGVTGGRGSTGRLWEGQSAKTRFLWLCSPTMPR